MIRAMATEKPAHALCKLLIRVAECFRFVLVFTVFHLVGLNAFGEDHSITTMLNRGELSEDEQFVFDLLVQWEDQQSEILTSRIEYRGFFTGSDLKELSPVEVEAIFKDIQLTNDAEAEFSEKYAPQVFVGQYDKSHVWLKPCLFITDGQKSRRDTWLGSHVFTDNAEIITEPSNDMIKIYDLGASSRFRVTLGDFRFTPPSNLWFKKVKEVDGQVWLQSALSLRPAVDAPDVVVGSGHRQVEQYVERLKDGSIPRMVFQSEFATYPGGAVFPHTIIDTRFAPTGLLDEIRFVVIDKADFNQYPSESDFHVPVAAHQQLVDFRSGKNNSPDSFRVEFASRDVQTVNVSIPATEGRIGSQSSVGFDNLSSLIIAVNSLALIALGLYLLHRRRIRSSKP